MQLAKTSLSNAVWHLNYESINDVIRAIIYNDAFVCIRVFVNDVVVAEQIQSGYKNIDGDYFVKSEEYDVRTSEIVHNTIPVGRMEIVISRGRLYEDLRSTAVSAIGLLLLLIGAIVVTTILIFKQYVAAPLAKLEYSAGLVTSGNLNTQIDVVSNHEIGRLAAAFNTMTHRLHKSFDTLEQKVIERTTDLSNAKNEAEKTSTNLALIGAEQQALLDSSPVGIHFTDKDRIIKRVNLEMAKLTGYSPGELLGKSARILYPDDNSFEAGGRLLFGQLERQGFCSQRVTYKRKNGAEMICQVRGRQVEGDVDMSGVVWSIDDITSRIRMEEELLAAKKMESVGVLAGGIAHDFNNILFAVIGNLSLAERLVVEESPVAEHIEAAKKAASRVKELTNKLLTLASGGELFRSEASLPKLVQGEVEFVLSGSNVNYVLEAPEDLWRVSMDTEQIRQVIQNLVLNAEQSMVAGGTLVISFSNILLDDDEVSGLASGEYVLVIVKDNGRGIKSENLDRVFDPYFSTKEKNAEKGSGLGLAIVHSIVQRHDGKITVESYPDQGTEFKIYLPSLARSAPPLSEPETVISVGKGIVLVMDDDQDIQVVVSDMLRLLGYEPLSAMDGNDALVQYKDNLVRGNEIYAVIMDLTIPGGMGGQEAVQKLLELDPEARAIATSGYSNDPVLEDYQDYGFCNVIAKPYQLLELNHILAEI